MIENLRQPERKICPFRSTIDTEIYCTDKCMLSIPCEDEPNGVTCSFTVLAIESVPKDED